MKQLNDCISAVSNLVKVSTVAFVLFGLVAAPGMAISSPDSSRNKSFQKSDKACKVAEAQDFLYRLRDAGIDTATADSDRDSFRENSAWVIQRIQANPSDLSNYLELAGILGFVSYTDPSAYDEAMTLYQFVLLKDTTGQFAPSVYLGIGGLLAIRQKYDQAIAQYNQILQNSKSNTTQIANAYASTGVVLEQLCQEKSALSAYKNAIYARPFFDSNRSEVTRFKEILKKQNRYGELLPFYQALLQEKTEPFYQASLLDELGTVFMKDFKQFDNAEKAYLRRIRLIETVLDLKGEKNSYYLPEAYIKLGDSLQGQGKTQAALTAYRTAAKTYQSSNDGIDAFISLTKDLQERGFPDLALSIWQKTVAFRPDNIFGLVELSRLYEQTGNAIEAIANYEKALLLKPKSEPDRQSQQYAKTQLAKLKQ